MLVDVDVDVDVDVGHLPHLHIPDRARMTLGKRWQRVNRAVETAMPLPRETAYAHFEARTHRHRENFGV